MSSNTIISLKTSMKNENFARSATAAFLVNVNQSPVTNQVIQTVPNLWKWGKNYNGLCS